MSNVYSRTVTTLTLVLALIAAIVVGVIAWAIDAGAEPNDASSKVRGTFTLQFHPPGPNCDPHPGPCLTGTMDGDVVGDVFVGVHDSLIADGSQRFVSVAFATFEVVTDDGVLTGAAAGFLDPGSSEFRDLIAFTGGTGIYADADGYVRSDGRSLPDGSERLAYEGWLRLPEHENRRLDRIGVG
ncbi:MAG: hypothetical protein ACRD0W_00950 [Acidimicrobiales bacterium]